jgi:hypothetical protein
MKPKLGTKILVAINIIAALGMVGIAGKQFLLPMAGKYLYKERYKELVFACDDVMRGHFIAKNKVMTSPSEESIQALRAAEVSLLTCHDYDKLRKKLQRFGLSEAELASLGLEAIEEKAKDVRHFVETHEIRY